MTKQPFSPHPKWREYFNFNLAYKPVDRTYTLDPIIEPRVRPILDFKLDPTIHKFDIKNT